MHSFHVNQIVKGKVCGIFMVLGFRIINGNEYAQLKEVYPEDFSKSYAGELSLPLDCIEEIDPSPATNTRLKRC